MKNIIIVALLVAVGVFGYFQWQDGKEQPNSNKARVEDRKTTEVIENRDIDFTVRVAGEISPADKVSVRPEVHGKIAELPVDISDRVLKGDLLFRLDDVHGGGDVRAARKDLVNAVQSLMDSAEPVVAAAKALVARHDTLPLPIFLLSHDLWCSAILPKLDALAAAVPLLNASKELSAL